MSKPPEVSERVQTRGEEIANSISHGIGLIAALAATPFLIMHAARRGDSGFIAGTSIFAASTVLLYFASALYHALPRGKAKRVFRVIEHSAIFLVNLHPHSGWPQEAPQRGARKGPEAVPILYSN